MASAMDLFFSNQSVTVVWIGTTVAKPTPTPPNTPNTSTNAAALRTAQAIRIADAAIISVPAPMVNRCPRRSIIRLISGPGRPWQRLNRENPRPSTVRLMPS